MMTQNVRNCRFEVEADAGRRYMQNSATNCSLVMEIAFLASHHSTPARVYVDRRRRINISRRACSNLWEILILRRTSKKTLALVVARHAKVFHKDSLTGGGENQRVVSKYVIRMSVGEIYGSYWNSTSEQNVIQKESRICSCAIESIAKIHEIY